jgi:hypothetical protein
MAFPGACPRLTLAVGGPHATGTQTAAIERQITTIHTADTHQILDSGHELCRE